jgi:hypothetical protein
MSFVGEEHKRFVASIARREGETKEEYYVRLIDQEEQHAAALERDREKCIREPHEYAALVSQRAVPDADDGYEGDHLP